MTERPAPPVTLTGGTSPAAARDPSPPQPERVPARRRRTPLVLVGLALLAATGVAELQERAAADQAARAEAEREREAVRLAVSQQTSGPISYEPETDSVSFSVLLRISNTGQPRATISSVDLPGVQLLMPVVLDTGRERGLTLRGEYSCQDDLAALLELDRLPLEVRTETGRQAVDLALGAPLLSGDAVRRACGITRPGLT